MAPPTVSFFQSRLFPFSVILLLFLVYALFPNQNPTSDAYDYAGCVKWRVDLWQPHHLLYNITGLGANTLMQAIGLSVEPLEMLQFLNSLFAGACLLVLWRMLVLLGKVVQVQAALLFIAGASFGTMRYATENETYIIPIFFSLLGSWFWLRCHLEGKKTDLLWSSFWAAFACLFHQIHFFWWLGLGFSFLFSSRYKVRETLWYLLPALVVPLVYAFVLKMQHIPLSQTHRFVFLDFFKGEVETSITYKNFLLFFISFYRTFFEVHGRMFFLGKMNLLYIIPALGTIICFVVISRQFYIGLKNTKLQHTFVFQTHLYILLLQLLFAWFAVGNAEFMVMVPALVVILVACFPIKHLRSLFLTGACLFTWNMVYAVLPNYFSTYENHACILQLVKSQPKSILLLQDKNAFDAYLFYQTGQYHPNAYEVQSSSQTLTKAIFQARQKQQPIITDFTNQDEIITRAWFLKKNTPSDFFQQYRLVPFASCPTMYGDRVLSHVIIPE